MRGRGNQLLQASIALAAAAGCAETREDDLSCGAREVWTLSDPVVTLGSIDAGPTAFSRIQRAVSGPDSEVYVLLPQEHQIRVFTEQGEYLGAIGRQGQGPGEFMRPTRFGFVGDTLWVLDDDLGGISYFHDGAFTRFERHPDLADLHSERTARVLGVLIGPTTLVGTDIQRLEHPAETTTPALLLRFDGAAVDTLALVNTDHTGGFVLSQSGGTISGISVFVQPFAAQDLWSISSDGGAVAVVDRWPSGGEPPSFGVAVISAWGDTLFSVRCPYSPISLSGSQVDSVVTSLQGTTFSRSQVLDALFVPDHVPPASRLLFGEDGTVWVERETTAIGGKRWYVFSLGGQLIAELQAPDKVELEVVGQGGVWGIATDELDVPYLMRYDILAR